MATMRATNARMVAMRTTGDILYGLSPGEKRADASIQSS